MATRSINPPTPGTAPDVAREEVALVSQAAGGSERALGVLYDRYAPSLFALALRLTGERSDAEEVVLDTFAQVWRDAARFQAARGSPGAWITMICRSRALDHIRARGRRARIADAAAVADPTRAPAMGSGSASPSEIVTQTEAADQVAAAMAGLAPAQRQAVELAFFEGLSHSEIATRLSEPLGTVKTRIRSGMQKLREVLRPFYPEVTG